MSSRILRPDRYPSTLRGLQVSWEWRLLSRPGMGLRGAGCPESFWIMSTSFFGRGRLVSDDPMVAQAARAAAKELAPQYGERLAMEVEAALHDAGKAEPPQFFDPVALSGVIVAIAALGWQVYRDLKKPSR